MVPASKGMGMGIGYVTGRMTRICVMTSATWIVVHVLTGGCSGDARVELTAADSVEVLGASMSQTLAEYHADLARFDEERQRAAVQAFIERVRMDVADEAATDAHAEAFRQALQHLDADRRAAWERYTASLDNVATLREIAQGLRRLALDSMSLDDDVRRYFGEVMERRKEAKELQGGKRVTNGEGQ